MYALHDNGRKLFTSPSDCTPMQRYVYVTAKNYHTPDTNTDIEQPAGMGKMQEFNNKTKF